MEVGAPWGAIMERSWVRAPANAVVAVAKHASVMGLTI